jgi:hypothetical protein
MVVLGEGGTGLLEHHEIGQTQWSGTRKAQSLRKILWLALSIQAGIMNEVPYHCLQTPLCCGLSGHGRLRIWPADQTCGSFLSYGVQRDICCPSSLRRLPGPRPRTTAGSRHPHCERSSSSLGILLSCSWPCSSASRRRNSAWWKKPARVAQPERSGRPRPLGPSVVSPARLSGARDAAL